MSDQQPRTLNPNETFLLLLVSCGLSTPYDLQSNAGLGPGLTSPALKRLADAGLLTSTPGARRSVRYALTQEGKERIRIILGADRSNLWAFLDSSDHFGSLPRSIVLAWLTSGSDGARLGIERLASFLKLEAQTRKRHAEELHASMLRIQSEVDNPELPAEEGKLIGTVYQWLNAEAEASLYRMQADAAIKMVKVIDNLPGRLGLIYEGDNPLPRPQTEPKKSAGRAPAASSKKPRSKPRRA